VNILIPPRKNAHIWKHGNSKAERHNEMKTCAPFANRASAWKQQSAITFALPPKPPCSTKTIFGDHLSTRLIETQTTQALIRCAALNQMTHLGMPQSDPVA